MKLVKLINIQYALYSSLVLIIGGVIFYFIIQNSIENSAKNILLIEHETINRSIKEANEIPKSNYVVDITPIYKNEVQKAFFSDTLIKKKEYKYVRHFLRYTICCEAKGGYYSVVLQQNLLESRAVIQAVVIAMVLIFIILGFVLIGINVQLMRRNLKPFYDTIERVKKYDVVKNSEIVFDIVKVFEFKELNNVLSNMLDKISSDYRNLKEYNENISHEIQTPLAVIRNKLEALLNQKDLSSEEVTIIDIAYRNTIELSKIIKGLTLISKIDNLEFKKEKINLYDQIEKVNTNFIDFFDIKNINVSSNIDKNFVVKINSSLIDMLMNNIFKNALRHNVQNGIFEIKQEGSKVIFMNSSNDTNEFELSYKRFKTQSLDVSSTGIGLSIVKKICDTHNFKIDYYSRNKMHLIVIDFGV